MTEEFTSQEIYLVQLQGKEKDKKGKDWSLSSSTKVPSFVCPMGLSFSLACLQNAKRYVVPSLQGTIRKLKEARENRNGAIKQFKNRLYAEFDASVWLRAIRVLAELDCLFSLAKASSALGEPACRPELVEGDEAFIDFEELRHPALCAGTSLKGDFIPNDVKLGESVGRIALLTGTWNLAEVTYITNVANPIGPNMG